MSSPPKKVGTPIHSYVFQFIRKSSPQKKAEPQFIVCIPMHSYVFQFIRMSSEKIETQFIRMSSNSLGGGSPPRTIIIIISRK